MTIPATAPRTSLESTARRSFASRALVTEELDELGANAFFADRRQAVPTGARRRVQARRWLKVEQCFEARHAQDPQAVFAEALARIKPRGIILSGGPASVTEMELDDAFEKILRAVLAARFK